MGASKTITIYELDENLEVSGKRLVSLEQTVIPLYSPPPELAGIRLQLNDHFHFVEELEIGWFDAEEATDYALANDSLWYLEIKVAMPGTTEEQYHRASMGGF